MLQDGGVEVDTNEMARYGAKEIADQLHQGLRRYLEAQYHVRDTGTIEDFTPVINRSPNSEYGLPN